MASEDDVHSWEELKDAYVATLAVLNDSLKVNNLGLDLRIDLVDGPLAKKLGKIFSATDLVRQVDWDWQSIYHKWVKREKFAWMFAISSSKTYGALCYGTVCIHDECVSIEYLERKLDVTSLKGLTAQIAIQYAEILAIYLKLGEVRISDPDPELITFYERNFGLTRQSEHVEVEYLSKKVSL